jgi:alpha-tubulin suppressor-like RCC1 family protein
MGDALPSVSLGTGLGAVAVYTGSFNTCARLSDGALKCWGLNLHGQLGLGDKTPRGNKAGQMGDALPPVDLGTGRTAVDVGLGEQHACARLDNGTVKCWGFNASGKLGYGDVADRGDAAGEMGNALAAVSLGSGKVVTSLAVGSNHNCAAFTDGTLKCWGAGNGGELGLGDERTRGDGPGEMGNDLPAVNLGTL